jgi:phosphoribosylanthranilate isomerase
MSLWVKICANTSLEDARLAADAGADAAGFVFAPSPRQVTAAQVAAIVPHLPPGLEKIGVFVDASFDEIAATVDAAGLTGVQLHFQAAPELPVRLRERFGTSLRILRVVHFDVKSASDGIRALSADRAAEENRRVSGHDFSRAENAASKKGALAPEATFHDPNVDGILVDSRTAEAVGGTGKTFDWATASKTLFQDAGVLKHLIAAGGLTPDNVAEAIATLRPWGVDAVSGVEAAPGRKDSEKVRAFVARARAATRD